MNDPQQIAQIQVSLVVETAGIIDAHGDPVHLIAEFVVVGGREELPDGMQHVFLAWAVLLGRAPVRIAMKIF